MQGDPSISFGYDVIARTAHDGFQLRGGVMDRGYYHELHSNNNNVFENFTWTISSTLSQNLKFRSYIVDVLNKIWGALWRIRILRAWNSGEQSIM